MIRIKLTKASDWNFEQVLLVESLGELITDLVKEHGRIVVDSFEGSEYEYEICIYDDYIE